MKIKKVDDKPMVIHTKEKAKIHSHEPKSTSIKGSNIHTVDRTPRIKKATVSELNSLRNIPDSFKKIVIVNGTKKPWRNDEGFVIMGMKYFLHGNFVKVFIRCKKEFNCATKILRIEKWKEYCSKCFMENENFVFHCQL